MIAFKDFLPKPTGTGGFLGLTTTYQSIDETVVAANQWIADSAIRVLNVETLLLPHLTQQQAGTGSAAIRTSGEVSSYWYQVIRVWYDA